MHLTYFILNTCTLQITKESVEGEGVLDAIKEVEPRERNKGFLEMVSMHRSFVNIAATNFLQLGEFILNIISVVCGNQIPDHGVQKHL